MKGETGNRSLGVLYLVASPIGNLEDITFRAVRILKEVDVIACEDTRWAKKLLSRYEIKKPLLSYHEHNEEARAKELIDYLLKGKDVALLSDAGTPLIDDPGYPLVKYAVESGIRVVPLPGPSAFLSALVASGLPCDRFLFTGFLPRKKGRKTRLWQIRRMAEEGAITLVFYEAPHRLKRLIDDLVYFFGAETQAVVAKELTKVNEDFLRGTLEEVQSFLSDRDDWIRGEFVVLVYIGKKHPFPEIKVPDVVPKGGD